MKKISIILIALTLLITGIVFATNKKTTLTPQSDKLQVASSFYPLYFFASEIGKEKVEVINLTASGIEPHDYEPTAQDIAKIQQGKLLLVNGAGLEAWVTKLQDDFAKNNVTVINTTQHLSLLERIEGEHVEEEGKDPHVWLNPILAKSQVDQIAEGFHKVDPQNSDYYKTNAEALKKKLDDLDKGYREGLSSCGKDEIITSHAAFGYLASQYGLTQVAISGISPEEEPSSQQLAQVADFAKTHNVKYIFFETLVSPKLADTIAQEVGAESLVLDPLEGISDDDKKQGKNYFTVMEDNLKNLQKALECNL